MQFTLLMVAAAIAMVGAIFHGYVGGRLYMKNIRESQLAPLTQSLSLVSWQMFTVFLLVSAITFRGGRLAASPRVDGRATDWANAAGACLFLVLSLMGHSALIKLPGLYLMGPYCTAERAGYRRYLNERDWFRDFRFVEGECIHSGGWTMKREVMVK
jgi:hypothetical protein